MASASIETLTHSDGYETHVRWWRPEPSRGAVLFFHGIQSHGGWYQGSGQRLADAGFTVLMPDRRGSGLNTKQRGHIESVERCVADAEDVLNVLLAETGEGAAHVVGISWGGKPAVALAARAPDRVRTLSLVTPGFFSALDLSSEQRMRIAMRMLASRDRMFEIPLNAARHLTRNQRLMDFVDADALKLTHVSLEFLKTTRRLDRTAKAFAETTWRGPIHLLLAGRDQFIDNEATRAWFAGLPSPDKRISLYSEAEHVLEFETNPDPYYADLAGWIADR